MSKKLILNNEKHLSAKDAGKLSGYTSDYVSKLCRDGAISCQRVGRAWLIEEKSLQAFLRVKQSEKAIAARELSAQRQVEYAGDDALDDGKVAVAQPYFRSEPTFEYEIAQPITGTYFRKRFAENEAALAVRAPLVPATVHSLSNKMVALALAVFIVLGSYTLVDADARAYATDTARTTLSALQNFEVREVLATARGKGTAAALLSQQTLAQVSAASVAHNVYTSVHGFFSRVGDALIPNGGLVFSGNNRDRVDISVRSITPPAKTVDEAPVAPPTQTPSTTVRTVINQPVIERIVQTERVVTQSGITLEQLQQAENQLRQEIARVSTANSTSHANNFQAIALTNKIDNLTDVTIANASISGGTITNAGVSASTLTVSNDFTTGLTLNSVPFIGASGVLSEDTSNFVWDDTNNRLGIGTTTPDNALAVTGGITLASTTPATSTYALYNNAGTLYWNGSELGGGLFTDGGTTSYLTAINTDNLAVGTTTALAKLTIQATSTSDILNLFETAGTEVFTVLENGNVGIGSTTPGSLLSVAGTLRATGAATLDSTLSVAASTTAAGGYFINTIPVLTASTTSNNFFFAAASSTSFTTGALYNYGFGENALTNLTTGDYNFAVGKDALQGSSTAGMTGSYNIVIGRSALLENKSGGNNIALGRNALKVNNSGSNNIALGSGALLNNTTGGTNLAFGPSALGNNTTGFQNAAFGSSALGENTTGANNVAFGFFTLGANTTGSGNFASGFAASSAALRNNTTGSHNIAIGGGAFFDAALDSNTTGSYNTALGYEALKGNTDGSYNHAFGYQALYTNNGTGTIAIGYRAADNVNAVDRGIFIGYDIDAASTTQDDVLNIGNLIFGSGIDGTGTTVSSGGISIGTTTNNARLTIQATSTSDILNLFETAGTEVFTVLENGNVGIGSTTAAFKLTVDGAIAPATNLTYDLGSSTARWKNLWAETLNVGTSTWSIFNGSDGRLAFSNAAEQAGTEYLSITTSGNMGIGTTSPLYTLDVANDSTATATARFINASSSDALIISNTNDNTFTASPADSTLRLINNDTTTNSISAITFESGVSSSGDGSAMIGVQHTGNNKGDFFVVTSNVAASSERFRITSGGSVGIGEETPGSKLSVSGNGSFGFDYRTTAAPSNGLIVQGNVGIGTTSPDSLFSVAGAAHVTGAATLDSTLGVTGAATLSSTLSVTATSTLATSTITSLSIGSLNGILQATNGLVSASSTISASSIQDSFLRNDADDTTTGTLTAANFVASSASATSTFAGGLTIESTGFVYDFATNRVGIGTANPATEVEIKGGSTATLRLGEGLTGNYFDWEVSNTGMTFEANGTDALTILNSGNVGIGTTTGNSRLTVQSTGTDDILNLFETAGTEVFTVLESGNVGIGSTTPSANLAIQGTAGQSANLFSVASSTGTQFLSVNSVGNVGIGTTTPAGLLHLSGDGTSVQFIIDTDAASQDSRLSFRENGSNQWHLFNKTDSGDRLQLNDADEDSGVYIVQNGTSWTANSDIRLKENIQTYSVLDKLDSFRAVSFDWKSNGNSDIGVIAQELYEVFPEAVIRGSDTDLELEPDNGDAWGVNYDKLGAFALGGLTELNTKVNLLASSTASTTQIFIDASGNVGIGLPAQTGTSTPTYKLHVAGDVAATGFVNTSSRALKTNITALASTTEAELLAKVRTTQLYTYDYLIDDTAASSTPLRFGLIAESAPSEVLSVSGGGIDLYKLATFTLAGVKALDERVANIDMRLATVEELVGATSEGGSKKLVKMAQDWLEEVGVFIGEGMARFTQLATAGLTVGTTEKPGGITLHDKATGEAYCLEIENGQMTHTPGACTVDSEQDTVTSAPTLTLHGSATSTVALLATYSDLGAQGFATSTDGTGVTTNVYTYLNGTPVTEILLDTATSSVHYIDYLTTYYDTYATTTRTVIIGATSTTSTRPENTYVNWSDELIKYLRDAPISTPTPEEPTAPEEPTPTATTTPTVIETATSTATTTATTTPPVEEPVVEEPLIEEEPIILIEPVATSTGTTTGAATTTGTSTTPVAE